MQMSSPFMEGEDIPAAQAAWRTRSGDARRPVRYGRLS